MFSIETQGSNTHLTYRVGAEDTLDSLSLGMVSNNSIKGIAPILFTQVDEEKYLKYNITAKIPLRRFLSGIVGKARFLSVMSGIVEAFLTAEDYMIEASLFVLDPDFIYVDVTSGEPKLICLPISDNARAASTLSSFLKGLIFDVQYDKNDDNDYVAILINALNDMETFSPLDFYKVVKELIQTPQKAAPPVVPPSVPSPACVPVSASPFPPAPAHTPSPVPLPPPPQPTATKSSEASALEDEKRITMFGLLMHYNKANKETYKAQKQARVLKQDRSKPEKEQDFVVPGEYAAMGEMQPSVPLLSISPPISPQQPISPPPPIEKTTLAGNPLTAHGETTMLGSAEAGETTVLRMGIDALTPYLTRNRNNERILLDQPTLRVGKERRYADYYIGDNPAISRSHAEFSRRDGQCFVTDMNSTNHTFVNGSMLPSSVETRLAHGDSVTLANEEFSFRLY